jgi:hypothetical protein
MNKVLELLGRAFKDEKTRLLFMASTFAIYILWTEWREEETKGSAFVLEQLKECKEAHLRCEAKMDQFAEYMRQQMGAANEKIRNLENIVE